jgi:peroxiredoxin
MPHSLPARLAWSGLALLLLATPAVARARRDPNATDLKTVFLTKPPPDFTFDATTGPTHLHDLAGAPVVLNFWASYCEPCRAELGAFAKIAATYGDAVRVLTVSEDEAGKAREFLQANGFAGLPVVEDPGRQIFDLYAVTPIPATVIIDRSGAVSRVVVGEMEWAELKSDIDAELTPAGSPAAASR